MVGSFTLSYLELVLLLDFPLRQVHLYFWKFKFLVWTLLRINLIFWFVSSECLPNIYILRRFSRSYQLDFRISYLHFSEMLFSFFHHAKSCRIFNFPKSYDNFRGLQRCDRGQNISFANYTIQCFKYLLLNISLRIWDFCLFYWML